MPKPEMILIDKQKFKDALTERGYSVASLCREFGYNKDNIIYSMKVGKMKRDLLFDITEKIGMFDCSKDDDSRILEALKEINKKLDAIISVFPKTFFE